MSRRCPCVDAFSSPFFINFFLMGFCLFQRFSRDPISCRDLSFEVRFICPPCFFFCLIVLFLHFSFMFVTHPQPPILQFLAEACFRDPPFRSVLESVMAMASSTDSPSSAALRQAAENASYVMNLLPVYQARIDPLRKSMPPLVCCMAFESCVSFENTLC